MTMTAAAFTELTAPHMTRLHRLGLRLTHGEGSDAADLVQEALCRAWANWGRFEEGGNLGAYLARIVTNTFISRHRHARVVHTTASRTDLVEHLFDRGRMAEAKAPERHWHAELLSDEVHRALQSLPAHYRDVVELVDLQGLPYKEASEALDIPLGTVMSRLHRARRLMRDQLCDYAASFGYAAAA